MIMLMRIASEGTKRKRRNGTKWHKIATSWVHGTSWLPLCTCQGGETQRSELAKLILHFQMERDDSQGLWKKKLLVTFFFFKAILGELCMGHAAALIRDGGV